jgi:hypothetical protein
MPKLNKEQKYDDLILHIGELEKKMIARKSELLKKKDLTPQEAYEVAYLSGYINALSIIDMNVCIKDVTTVLENLNGGLSE